MKEKKLPMQMRTWLCLLLLLVTAGWSSTSFGQASLVTDKDDYQPGETVTMSGSNWLPGETIQLVLEHLHFNHQNDTLSATADDYGNFVNSDLVIDPSDLGELFMLVGTGESSGYVVITYFTDGPAVSGDGTMNLLPRFLCGGGTDLTYTAAFTGESGNEWAAGSYLTMNVPWLVSGSNVSITNPQRVTIGTLAFLQSGSSTLITIPFQSNGNNPQFNIVISGVTMPVEASYKIEVMTSYGGSPLQPIDLNPEIASSAVYSGHISGGISSCSSVASGSLYYYGSCDNKITKWQYRPLVDLTTNPITWGSWEDIQNSSDQLNLSQSYFNASGVDVLQFRALATAASCCGVPIGISGSNNVYESDYAMIAEVTNPIIQATDIASYAISSPAFGVGTNVNVFSIVPVNSVVYYINYGTPEQLEITSGYDFGFGTTTTVTVVAANFCASSTETFTVATGLAPQIVCPASITQNTDPGVCNAMVNYALTYVADPGQTLVAGQYNGLPEPAMYYSLDNTNWTSGTGSGLTYPKGSTTVYLKAENSAGEASCSFVVTVEDKEAPQLTGTPYSDATLYNACKSEALTTVPTWTQANAIIGFTDNCPGSLTAILTETEVSGSDCAWTVNYTYTVFDDAGNPLLGQTYIHNGKDQTAPSLAGTPYSDPTEYNACFADALTAVPAWSEANAIMGYSDLCGAEVTATLTSTVASGDDCDWVVTYTYSVFDECLNELPGQTYVHNGKDQTAPSLTGTPYSDPTEYNACFADALTAVPAWSEANAIMGYSDLCGADVTATLTSTVASGDDCDWVVTYTYSVFDECLNELPGQTYVHNGKDQTAPSLTGTPYSDPTEYNACFADALTAVPAWSEANAIMGYSDLCGADVTATLTSTVASGDDCDWVVTYTYSVFDECLNELPGQTYVHNGKDQTAPSLTGTPYSDPTEYNACFADALTAVPAWSEANAIMGYSDLCGAEVTATLTSTVASGDDCDWVVTYTYSVFDECLNELPGQTYVHNGKDQTAPSLTGTPYSDPTEYNACFADALTAVPAWSEANAIMGYSDLCGADVTATLTSTVASGDDCDWVVTYTYSVFDECLNELPGQTYVHNGKDQTAPSLTGTPYSDPTEYNACFADALTAVPAWSEANAIMGYSDLCGADVTATLTSTVASGDDCDWVVTYTYSVFDECLNELPGQTYVHNGKDQTAPSLTGTPYSDPTEYNACFADALTAVPAWSEANAIMGYSDLCGADVTATLTSTVASGDDCDWVVTYTYSVFDECLNELPGQTYVHNGKDQTAPSLTGTPYSDPTEYNACFADALTAVPAWSEANAIMGYSDLCGADVTATLTSTVASGDDCDWVVTYTYSVFDECLNELPGQTYVHNGKDQTAPSLTSTPYSDPTEYNACFADALTAVPAWSEANAIMGYSDLCGADVTATLTSTVASGDDCDWVVTYTYSVFDECLNELPGQTYVHNGKDQTPPTVITQNITVSLNSSGTVTIDDDAVDNGSYDNCEGVVAFNVEPNTFDCDDIGENPVTLTVTDLCGNFATGTAIVTITVPTVTTAYVSADAARYMDEVTLYAEIESYCGIDELTGNVEFFLDGVSIGSAPAFPIPFGEEGYGEKLRASMLYKIAVLPKTNTSTPWIVTAKFTPETEFYLNSEDDASLLIYPREATPFSATAGFYTGPIYAWTTTPTSSTGTVTLSATIVDANVPVGDVRGAIVSFYYINSSGGRTPIPSAQNLPVGLVNQLDGTVGTASADVQLNLGNQLSADYTVGIEIKGGYMNDPDSPESQALITIYKQTAGGRINGSAELVNTENTNGHIKGAIGETTEVSFDVTYNKKGRNPQGRVTIVIWSWYDANGLLDNKLHKYIITSNAINATVVNQPNQGDAYFSSKANLKEEIDGQTISIQGNSVLQMWLFDDNNNGGPNGLLGIQYDRMEGGIWYSNNWNGTKTVMDQIAESPDYAAGIVQVSADGSKSTEEIVIQEEMETETESQFIVFPNPASDKATFRFVPQTDTRARLELYSVNGALLQTLFEGNVKAGEVYEMVYQPEVRVTGMVLYRLILDQRVINGKLQIQR